MKTLLSINGFEPFRIGSGETFARNLSLELAKHGWRHVLCFLTPPTEPVRQFLDLPNVTLEAVPDLWKLAWRPTLAVGGLLRRHRPEIVHLQFTGFLSPYPWLAKCYGVKKVFFTDQASRPEGFQAQRSPWWKRAATRAINYPLTRVTCISDYVMRYWDTLDVLPRDRFIKIYNSVDVFCGATDGAPFRRKYGIPLDRLLVAQISWIIPEKGFDDLLEAARLVIQQDPTVHFVMAGEGAHRARYMELTTQMGLKYQVTWTGMVGKPQEGGLYAAADIVCQVSRWEEAFGCVIAEAMAGGKPVVGTRAGAISELVLDGKTGFLVDRRAPAQIAARILELSRDPSLRQRLGEAGRQLAVEEFNQQKAVMQFMKLYGF
jgi:glycosyltransferase involved in cell wall biosynthesis